MKQIILIITTWILFYNLSFAQGDIDIIKNQSYLKLPGNINCDSTNGVTIIERICANLAFQKSDSILTVYYLQISSGLSDSDTSKLNIKNIQKLWREYRNNYCSLLSDGLNGNTGGIIYLKCMKKLTDHRIEELKSFIEGEH